MVQAQTITTDAGAQGLASRLCGNEGEITRRLRLVEALIGVVAQQSMDLVEARDDVDYHNRQGRHSEQRTFEAAEALGRLQAEVDLAVGTLGAIHSSLRTLLDDLRLAAYVTAEPADTADATSPTQDTSIAGDGGREGTL